MAEGKWFIRGVSDEIVRQVTGEAKVRGQTVGRVVTDLLRDALARQAEAGHPGSIGVPSEVADQIQRLSEQVEAIRQQNPALDAVAEAERRLAERIAPMLEQNRQIAEQFVPLLESVDKVVAPFRKAMEGALWPTIPAGLAETMEKFDKAAAPLREAMEGIRLPAVPAGFMEMAEKVDRAAAPLRKALEGSEKGVAWPATAETEGAVVPSAGGPPGLVSQADFARAHGVSRKTVTKWKGQGRLVMDGELVDVAASERILKPLGLGRFRPAVEGGQEVAFRPERRPANRA